MGGVLWLVNGEELTVDSDCVRSDNAGLFSPEDEVGVGCKGTETAKHYHSIQYPYNHKHR